MRLPLRYNIYILIISIGLLENTKQSKSLLMTTGLLMTESLSSFFILLGGLIGVLLLWYASYRLVRWDTNRRGVRAIERKAWIAVTVALPLFGFALYLFMQALRRYLTPPAGDNTPAGSANMYVPPMSLDRDLEQATPDQANRQALNAMLQQVPMPEPAWGNTNPAHSNGKAHAFATPETIRSPYQALRTRYSLFVTDGPHQGQQFIVKSLPLRIGRGPEAGIALDADLNISRAHAELYEWNGKLRIRDLGSMHGIHINGVAANDQALGPGDRITLGGTVLILRELP